jgi:quercetin dioxygenase-like cupin family protein
MIAGRDFRIGACAVGATFFAFAIAGQQAPIIGASVYDWNSIPATKTDVGEVRQFFKGPTATLEELEVHVTTLNPGQISHPPHRHENEELVILREGTVEALVNGEWKRLGPGSVIFNASNSLHGLRNVGTGPATYHVINWKAPPKGK